jgi:hypothetical protein
MRYTNVVREEIAMFDDGEITSQDRSSPFIVVPPRNDESTVLYVTKWPPIYRASESSVNAMNCGVVARYGIPNVEEISWVKEFAKDRKLLFLGDCDPFDLLVYSAISSVFAIEYLGVSDRLIKLLDVNIERNITIPLATAELDALEYLQLRTPQLESLLGANCYRMLTQGRKMEVEAIINFARQPLHRLFDLTR